MQSTIQLFNTAIGRLGGEQLLRNVSPQEDDALGALCQNLFPLVLDAALEAHSWSFAIKRVSLALLPDLEPLDGEYRLRYALPADCMRPIRLDGCAGVNLAPAYVVQGGALCTNVEQAVLEYAARVDDPKQWPPSFADALAWGLAAELASARLNDANRHQRCLQMYEYALARAGARDKGKQNPHRPRSRWVEARGQAGPRGGWRGVR